MEYLTAEEQAKWDSIVDDIRAGGVLCHNCKLDDELTNRGHVLGSDELVYQCIDPREVDGPMRTPCTDLRNCGCYVDPREVDDLPENIAADIQRQVQ